MRKTKSGLPRVLSLGLTALLLTSCAANPPAETNAQPEPVATTAAPEGVYANTGGYISYETYSAAPEKYSASNVVLFYNAYWCSTCKAARDGFESGLGEIPEDLTIVLVDFDENTEMRKKHDVIVQHTFIQIDSAGNELQRWYGSTTVAEIEAKIS
jgi:thiol-disulfide isomerase/thioredoxin